MTDLHRLTATETLARLAAGRLAAADVAEALEDAIGRREPELRAFAFRDAAAARRAALRATGPLAGLHLGVKDVLDTADLPSQYGSAIWSGHRPRADASAVALARRAGLAVAGKTVTTEFATRRPGPTRNPHDGGRTPGGSSSGSAAGVAAGLFHLGFGTQTAGSIIRPAAFCGAHALKPSFGTFHRAGMKVMSESLDTIGLFARSLDDLALAMSAATGRDHGRPSERAPRPPRLLLTMGPGEGACDDATRSLLLRAADAARRAGATVEDWALPPGCREAAGVHAHVMNREVADALAWERDHALAQLSPGLRETTERALAEPPERLVAGRAAFARARDEFAAALAGFDAVLTPAAPGEAPAGLDWTGDPACNALWTALHVPCVALPAGTGPAGMPLGLQVVAPFGADAAALRWAAWLGAAL